METDKFQHAQVCVSGGMRVIIFITSFKFWPHLMMQAKVAHMPSTEQIDLQLTLLHALI